MTKTPIETSKTPKVSLSLGGSSWITYDKKQEKKLKKLKLKSTKIIFYASKEKGQKSYLVSQKKHSKENSEKDNKWEFPGGKIDKKEKVLSALIREASEEDNSQILSKCIETTLKKEPEQVKYKIIQLKDGTKHCIFLLPLKQSLCSDLETFYKEEQVANHESYGFKLIPEELLNLNKENKINWTPKSIKLLKSLKKERILSL